MTFNNDTPVHCEAFDCDWKGVQGDCETAMESEGWEYPEYDVLICPKCGEHTIYKTATPEPYRFALRMAKFSMSYWVWCRWQEKRPDVICLDIIEE